MNFIVGLKSYDKNDVLYLGEGREGESYLVDGLVVKKLFPFPSKLYLQEEDVERLKGLKTMILEHPITIAMDEKNHYIGPVSTYIRSNGYYNFSNLKSTDFIKNITLMQKDCKVYAKNHYLIADLQYEDTIFDQNGNFHLVDSGSYTYKPNIAEKILEQENLNELDNYLLEEVIDYLLTKKNISKKKKDLIKDNIKEEARNYDNISEYLCEAVKEYNTLNEYIGKIRK